METSQGIPPLSSPSDKITEKEEKISSNTNAKSQADSMVISQLDQVNIKVKEVYKGLTLLAQKVLSKLDEILQAELPNGIASLNPEDHTAEKTAQRIADGVTALFPIFAKQNPELQGEELMSAFLETVNGGIKQGYSEAVDILKGIGAFEFEGVESGIEETMKLVDQKLKAFADNFLSSLKPKAEEKTDNPEQPQNPTSVPE